MSLIGKGITFFRRLTPKAIPDPVKDCALYKDKTVGSCAYVDGPLCDFPDCSMNQKYVEEQRRRNFGGPQDEYVCTPEWFEEEGNFGDTVLRCSACRAYKGARCRKLISLELKKERP